MLKNSVKEIYLEHLGEERDIVVESFPWKKIFTLN